MFLDHVANFFLFFSNIFVVAAILLVLGLRIGRAFFLQCFCLTFLGMIVNVALKGTFKVLPPPFLEGGYAFPSGHMQLTCIFYGWILLHVRSSVLRGCLFMLCLGQGMGLIHYHYHTLFDVLGGVFFATLMIVLYRKTLFWFKKQTPWVLLCASSLCMLYNLYAYKGGIPLHAVQSYEALLVVLILERIFSKNGKKGQDWQAMDLTKVSFL